MVIFEILVKIAIFECTFVINLVAFWGIYPALFMVAPDYF